MGTVLLAAPCGYCAGVERAVDAVERALEQHDGPVYVRKQIVHNLHVVRGLEERAPSSWTSSTRCPRPRSSSCRPTAPRRRSTPTRSSQAQLIDATCPLVTKVHLEARRFADDDRTHHPDRPCRTRGGRGDERTGARSDDPGAVDRGGAAGRGAGSPSRLCYLTQTTLSVDETGQIVDALRSRFPEIQGPPREDICYATQNRQDAVKEVARPADVVLVIGSRNSSNSNRLAEVSQERGTPPISSTTRPRSTPRGWRVPTWSG